MDFKAQKLTLYGLIVIAIILPTSCAKINQWKKNLKTQIDTVFTIPNRAVATALPLDDFPPPLNFYLLKDESWSYRDGKYLYSKIIYKGSSKVQLVANFYNNVLQSKGWNVKEQKVVDNYIYIYAINSNNNHKVELIIKNIPDGTLVIIYLKPL